MALTRSSGVHASRRARQEREWMHALVREGLDTMFQGRPGLQEKLAELEQEVTAGRLPATAAARRLLDLFAGTLPEKN